MKFVFFTEGGQSIGMGHLSRCLALAQALQKKFRKADVQFLIQGDDYARRFLKAHRMGAGFVDWSKDRRTILKYVHGSDYAVVDSYLMPKSLYDGLSRYLDGRILMVDDFKRIVYPRGTVVNPSVDAGRIKYPQRSDIQYLAGENYAIVRPEFRRTAPVKAIKAVRNVMITFGGMRHKEFIPKVVRSVGQSFPTINVHVALGGANADLNGIQQNFSNVIVQSNLSAHAMRSLMQRSDLAISGCGQTLYELARMGMPTIGVKFADNQNGNIRGFRRNGYMLFAGDYQDQKVFGRIGRLMTRAIDDSQWRRRVSTVGPKLIDGKGVERIAAAVEQSLKPYVRLDVRMAKANDTRDLWLWRNHPDVRQWSFDQGEISWADHTRWFKRKMNDRNVQLIIVLKGNQKVGQVRFERRGPNAEIHVNLNPKFLGQGLGRVMIGQVTRSFCLDHADIKTVIAEIIQGNIASEKAFTRAGYEFYKTTRKNGNVVNVFRFRR